MDKNELIQEMVGMMQNPWAGEIGGSRKQMFSEKALQEAREFEDHMRKIIHDAIALPNDMLVYGHRSIARTYHMRLGRLMMKIRRAVHKKFKHGGAWPDMEACYEFLAAQLRNLREEEFPRFEQQLKCWNESSFVSAAEFWQQIVFKREAHRTFVEKAVDVFTSRDGWELFMQYAGDDEIWVLRDPYGQDVESMKYFHEFAEKYPAWTTISHRERYGRTGYTDKGIKFGPAHFPKGTVVQTYVDGVDKELQTYTVDHVIVMGARNYLLIMQEIKKGIAGSIHFGDEPHQLNLVHVRKIVKRGEGKVDLRDDVKQHGYLDLDLAVKQSHAYICECIREEGFEMPHLKKGETFFGSENGLVGAIQDQYGIPDDHKGKWIDDSKFHRYMVSAGFGRFVSLFNADTVRFDSFYAIDAKKLVKFMQKYPDRLFMTLRQVEKLEEEMDRKDSEDLARHFD